MVQLLILNCMLLYYKYHCTIILGGGWQTLPTGWRNTHRRGKRLLRRDRTPLSLSVPLLLYSSSLSMSLFFFLHLSLPPYLSTLSLSVCLSVCLSFSISLSLSGLIQHNCQILLTKSIKKHLSILFD